MILRRYPMVFGVESVNLGGFTEVINPSAVDRALRDQADVVALKNHNADHVLGRVSAGTLRLTKETRGLLTEIDLDPGISYAADLMKLNERRDAPGGSFGFIALEDIWTFDQALPRREVLDMVLKEISVGVAFPAYLQTQRDTRALTVTLAERMTRQRRLMESL